MKILLIYYTGTFNTRYLTNKIADEFIKDNNEITKIEIDNNTKTIDTTTYDLIGFGYPIYAFNSPMPFNQYIRKLSFKKNQRYFIYKDSGETLKTNNASSRVIKRIFNKFKMKCIGEYHYIMPYNIRFPFPKQFIKEILVYDQKLLTIMFYNFKHNIVKTLKSSFINNTSSVALSIQKPGANLNSFFYTVDNDKCIRCLKCVKECPTNNIKLIDNKITFSHNCNMCMRCSYYCPNQAIKIGMLENWKVCDYYNLDEIEKCEYVPYINENSKGFYKCFIKTFKQIDKEYNSIINKKDYK